MFKFFRDFFKSKIGLAISLAFLGLIALAFASADVSSTGTFGGIAGGDRVAVVGDEKIGTSELVSAANNGLDRVRQENPTITMPEFVASGQLTQVLDALIDRYAIAGFADKYGLRVGDNLLNSEIRMIPAFRGTDGNFSEDAYRQAIAQQGMSDAQVRDDLAVGLLSQQMMMPAGYGAAVPDKLAFRYAQLFKERRKGTIALLTTAAFAPAGTPDEKVLRAYYDGHRSEFVRPERRTVRFVTFDSSALGDRIEPTEAEIAARYKRDAAQYAASETRDFTQLIVPTEAAAKSISDRVAAGASFENVAREAGLRAADVDGVSRSTLTSQASAAVAQAYFGAAQGSMTAPARSALGWHVARVDSVAKTPARSLAQAREEITKTIREEKRVRGLADLAIELEEKLDEGQTLAEVASDLNLKLATTAPLLADGRVYQKQGETAPAVLAPALATAFQMEEEDPEIAPIAGGETYLVFEAADITPSATAPFAEIKEQVAGRWRAAEGAKAAQAAADRVLKRVRGGMGVAAALQAEKRPLPPVEAIDMTREQLARQRERRIPPPLALMFSMAEGTTKKLEGPGDIGFFVVDVDSIAMDKMASNDPLVGQAHRQMGPLLGEEYAEQLRNAMRAELGVEKNPTALQAVRKQLAGS